jgi:hypothetical protein
VQGIDPLHICFQDKAMKLVLSAGLTVVGVLAFDDVSSAQSRARIMQVEFGTHVSELPIDEWVDPSCGTNGGPPSIELESFDEFALCPTEATTALREIWFIYDDEWEYIARAYGDPIEILSYSANMFFQQPIITSLLVDDAGLVQGYRIITDPETPNEVRREAYTLYGVFKGLFADAPWQCEDLPPSGRETPVEGSFLKTDCVMVSDERFVKLEARLLRKPGQNPREYAGFRSQTESFFESSVRLEVYSTEAVRHAPCCQPFIGPSASAAGR